MHLLLYSNRKKRKKEMEILEQIALLGVNHSLHFGEGFIVVSSWKSKRSTPIIEFDEEMGEAMQRKKKNGMNPKLYFTWSKIVPKTCSKEMTVTYSSFNGSVTYTLGKTVFLIRFSLKMIFLVTVSFLFFIILAHCAAISFYYLKIFILYFSRAISQFFNFKFVFNKWFLL